MPEEVLLLKLFDVGGVWVSESLPPWAMLGGDGSLCGSGRWCWLDLDWVGLWLGLVVALEELSLLSLGRGAELGVGAEPGWELELEIGLV